MLFNNIYILYNTQLSFCIMDHQQSEKPIIGNSEEKISQIPGNIEETKPVCYICGKSCFIDYMTSPGEKSRFFVEKSFFDGKYCHHICTKRRSNKSNLRNF